MTLYDDEFEESFFFITDQTLRKNMGDALRYVAELSAITDVKKYPPTIRSTFYKTCIIYLASVIEACLHFCVAEILGDFYESPEWTYQDMKVIYKTKKDSTESYSEIVAGKRVKQKKPIKRYIDFQILNKVCLQNSIINEKKYKKVEEIRKLRNKIHLFSLAEVDRKYSQEDVDSISKTVNTILSVVERKLKSKLSNKQ